jgi:hypothetical protein
MIQRMSRHAMKATSDISSCWLSPRLAPAAVLVHPRDALNEIGIHDSCLRLSSCRNHSATRFQLAPVWSTNSFFSSQIGFK